MPTEKLMTLLKSLLSLLGKAVYLFRPAKLEFAEKAREVSINGSIATIGMNARFDRGLILWWGWKDNVTVPIPMGLNLGIDVHGKNSSDRIDSQHLENTGLSVDISDFLEARSKRWHKGDLIQFDLACQCDTKELLDFPSSIEGHREQDEAKSGCFITKFQIRKKYQFRDVEIRNYEWRTNVKNHLPLEKIIVTKNGSQIENIRIDVVNENASSGKVDSISLDASGNLIVAASAYVIHSDAKTLSIPLSFEERDDTYEILLWQKIV